MQPATVPQINRTANYLYLYILIALILDVFFYLVKVKSLYNSYKDYLIENSSNNSVLQHLYRIFNLNKMYSLQIIAKYKFIY